MVRKNTLSAKMTLEQFDNGYWYATELKDFALSLGLSQAASLRKDQIEKQIRDFLKYGNLPKAISKKSDTRKKAESADKKISAKTLIQNYKNSPETKNFLLREAKRIESSFKIQSGCMYRLNRWREDEIQKGRKITYGDLARKLVELSQNTDKFEKIPSTRYINFLSEYSKFEKTSNREEALAAWQELKVLEIPKTYQAWKAYKRKP